MIKTFIRRFVPEPLISLYHLALAHIAAILYGHPSERLIVVGVTGTNGKSSTVQYIGRILEQAGYRVGWTTTVGFKIGEREWTNDKKMTMLGRFQTQRLLRRMVDDGCTHAIVETSSQGISQFRHVGIHYDVGVFTNLTPEHVEAHGGFENYKRAKGKLFEAIAHAREKVIDGTLVKKATIANALDPHTPYFASFRAGELFLFGREAQDIEMNASGTQFSIQGVRFSFAPIGRFNFENVLAAIATSQALGLSIKQIAQAVSQLQPIPGRLESIDEGQPFHVIVDYAPEPAALQAVYDAMDLIGYARLIHVLGSTGGGRDVARRAVLGKMAAQKASSVVVTNEDPYDDDPMEIINQIADACVAEGKQDGVNVFRILDRQEAIQKAVSLARAGDAVLLTGKGCEPVMAVAHGRKIPWDDREAARQALRKL